ncbi:DUF6966 domain-containing protein [Pseudomonas veronii]|uniref:DUF6966 domain-containing protein n=2 Tax=Pseudomonas TaxID=286 RepID=UPI002F3F638C
MLLAGEKYSTADHPAHAAFHFGRCPEMGPKTEELICILDQLAIVLESDGDTHWSFWMRKARALLLDSDYSGIEYLLSAYGGMGSLNDLILGQSYVDGVLSWNPGHVELNEKFIELRNNAEQLSNAIKRSQT